MITKTRLLVQEPALYKITDSGIYIPKTPSKILDVECDTVYTNFKVNPIYYIEYMFMVSKDIEKLPKIYYLDEPTHITMPQLRRLDLFDNTKFKESGAIVKIGNSQLKALSSCKTRNYKVLEWQDIYINVFTHL